MTLPKSYVDGFLVEWEAGEYEAQVKSMRQKSEAIDLRVPRFVVGTAAAKVKTTAQRAQAVRDRLARTVRKVPEVMVKITSSCRGMKQIGRHIDYISRKGQIDLEDQDGLVLTGKEQLKDLKEDWRIGGAEEIAAESERRDTLNIVFSMPAHTDELSMKRAVRAFAAAIFDDHQYVFAYHTQASDPDPNPPAHPHVHLAVKTQARSGRRLNPRKADLQRWREAFAAQLRAHGIEANATSRLARLQPDRGPSRAQVGIAQREGHPFNDGAPKAKQTHPTHRALEQKRRNYYKVLGDILSQSDVAGDRELGAQVLEHFTHRIERSGQSPSQDIDR